MIRNLTPEHREILKKESEGYSDWRRKNEPARIKFEKSKKSKK